MLAVIILKTNCHHHQYFFSLNISLSSSFDVIIKRDFSQIKQTEQADEGSKNEKNCYYIIEMKIYNLLRSLRYKAFFQF